ncbi:S24 family peptidase [Stappia sp.]|uniref:S24 family peptidase n=1 Tax=Stappia sp. TaxID=1870903 RepID=UPI003A996590
MLSHESVWSAIDRLARRNGLTPSGLARRAGLDPTTFNPSKRTASDGRPRWPSMESIAKILGATRSELADFVALIDERGGRADVMRFAIPPTLPPLGLSQAEATGFFHDGAMSALAPETLSPVADGLLCEAPDADTALRVENDTMLPLYREGDVVVISPRRPIDRGDRVMLRLASGPVLARVFERRTRSRVELAPLIDGAAPERLGVSEIAWMARIIWASQ